MKKLALTLVVMALAAPVAAAPDVAPAVKRKPAAASTPPAAPQPNATGPTPSPIAPQQAVRTLSERDSYHALTAAAGQSVSDSALDTSLIRVMSRLVSAGRCGEAATLASRDGRKDLAARAQQLCK
ncbi:MAG: hypothetical protein ABWX67_14075 [Allosphingosinicella sp.]